MTLGFFLFVCLVTFKETIPNEWTQDCRNYVRYISRTDQVTIMQGFCEKKIKNMRQGLIYAKCFAFTCTPSLYPRVLLSLSPLCKKKKRRKTQDCQRSNLDKTRDLN